MQVREGMTEMVLTVGPGHTLRGVAQLMSQRQVGAAVVMDPDGHGPGIITERDILVSRRLRAGSRPRVRRRPSDARCRVRRARLVAGGGRRGDGARRLPSSDRPRTGGDGRHPVGARRRALLDRRWGDLPGARQGGRGVKGRWHACPWGGARPATAHGGRWRTGVRARSTALPWRRNRLSPRLSARRAGAR